MSPVYTQSLRPRLLDWHRSRARDARLRTLCHGLSMLVALLLAATLADRLLDLSPAWRIGLWCAGVVLTLVLTLPPLLRSYRSPDVRNLATQAEGTLGLAAESLSTVVHECEHPTPGVSRPMVDQLARAASEELPRLVHRPTWRKSAGIALAALSLAAMLTALIPQGWTSLLRVSLPWASIAPVRSEMLLVSPQGLNIRQGDTVRIVATLDVSQLPDTRLRPVLETTRDGIHWSPTDMSPRGSAGFVVEMQQVSRGFDYRVRAGSEVSGVFSVRVLTEPAVRSLVVEARYPRSLGGESATLTPTRDDASGLLQVRVPLGTLLQCRLAVTEPLERLTAYAPGLILSGSPAEDSSGDFIVALPLEVTSRPGPVTEVRFELLGRNNTSAWTRMLVTTLPDSDPVVRVLSPQPGTPLGPRDDIEVLVLATDDTGLSRAHLRLTTPRGPTTVPVAIEGTPRKLQRRARVSLAPLGLVPGEPLTLAAHAEDLAGRSAESAPVLLEISATAPDPLTAARVASLGESVTLAGSAVRALDRAAERLRETSWLPEPQRSGALPEARLAVASAGDALSRVQPGLAWLVELAPESTFADAVARLADTTVGAAALSDAVLTQSATSSAEATRALADTLGATAQSLQKSLLEPLTELRRGETAALLIGSREAARSMVAVDDSDLIFADEARLEEVSRVALSRLQSLPAPDLTKPPDPPDALPQRLELAWRIEALRPDAIAARASDLALAARAARAQRLPTATSSVLDPLTTLETHHLARRLGGQPPAPESVAAARQSLRSLVGEAASPAPDEPAPPVDDSDARRSARLLELGTSARTALASLRQLPRPADERSVASMEGSIRELIRRLDALEGLPSPAVLQPRIEAFRAASAAEVRLETLDTAVRQLRTLLAARQRLLAQGPPGSEELASVNTALANLRESLQTRWADAIRDELRRFVPELAPAAVAADRSLKPALAGLGRAFEEAAASTTESTAASLQTAIDALYRVQREVDAARTAMTRRDPIAAARANLAAAASSLRRRDVDLDAAGRFLASADRALSTAADQSARARTLRSLPGISEWTNLTGLSLATAAPGAEPVSPGTPPTPDLAPVPEAYREAVRAYFQSLSRQQGEGGTR